MLRPCLRTSNDIVFTYANRPEGTGNPADLFSQLAPRKTFGRRKSTCFGEALNSGSTAPMPQYILRVVQTSAWKEFWPLINGSALIYCVVGVSQTLRKKIQGCLSLMVALST